MKSFKELEKKEISEIEHDITEKWKKMDILKLSIEKGNKDKNFVFYDGPIYANAKPGLHHVFAKTIKDAFCKYKTMNGYKVLRKIGLDTHGLPIEVNVEKKLGFKNKGDIEKLGIEQFCSECKKETASNIDEVKRVTDMMGQFIDCENPYVTCDNKYIETEWWIVNELNKKGLIYNGNKVLPYCPRCGTELASHEVSQGYKEVSVNTVIVPFKLVSENTYVLVWTTTPWTLIANVALCVNPDMEYYKVKSMGYNFIVGKSLASKVLGEDFEILDTMKGTDLVGKKYEQLIPEIKVEGKAFEIIEDSYVTDEDGTGIVHIAPAYGVDDNRACIKNGISFVNPVGKDGCYTEGPWKGQLVTSQDLEIEIIKYLKQNDKLFKKIKMSHDYPHCWRCKQPLIYYSKPAWYVNNTKYKQDIIDSNNTVNWFPDYIGTKRFNNWLENMIDWGISRNRYWGCPLPIWTCDCGHFETIGSFEDLKEKSIEEINIDTLEFHRPYVDNIHIVCPKCGNQMSRVKDVLDVWFDSGCMPYAQYHYPFENKKLFESQFPADFIAEGVDQTRGWFYVLIVLSTIISDKSSFKNVVVNDMMLDAFGKKMSKSTGNIIDPIEVMTQYGADPVKWYMLYASPIWTPLKFNMDGIKEVHSKFFNPLKNTYNFFAIYANADKINDINTCKVDYKDREDIDKWMLSKYNTLIKNVVSSYESYDLNKVVKYITEFTCEDLSNWYIRRNRKRFWESDFTQSKKAVYITTFEVLTGLCKLIAPIASFTAEDIYTKLTDEESIHLTNFPIYNDKLVNDDIVTKMDLVRDLISIGRNVREETKIKVRQPLSEILLDNKIKSIINDLTDLIKEELNVKKITFVADLSKYMNFIVKPNFKIVGKILGPNIKEFQNKLLELTNEEVSKLENNQTIIMNINNEDFEVNLEMVDIRIDSKEGFNVGMYNNQFVILNTTLSKELINEGIARETVSKIQQLRKTLDFDIIDRINVYYNSDDEYTNSIKDNLEFIKNETLSLVFNKVDETFENEIDVNDKIISIKIEKA